jgi:hypothetical protein
MMMVAVLTCVCLFLFDINFGDPLQYQRYAPKDKEDLAAFAFEAGGWPISCICELICCFLGMYNTSVPENYSYCCLLFQTFVFADLQWCVPEGQQGHH